MAAKKRTTQGVTPAAGAEPGPQAEPLPQTPDPAEESSAGSHSADRTLSADALVGSEGAHLRPPVAALVASAGGLEAFKGFLSAAPPDSGIGFVLVPHLDPRHASLMVELISRQTTMPVVEAEEGMAVEADHVYILPPNKYMTISGGALRLTGPVERGGLPTSIDLFLRSLADDQQEQAICIILSGTGAHGTLGLKAVKAAGGMAMVQDPATAEHPGMPRNAIATDLADYVLRVEQMPDVLIRYVRDFSLNRGRVVAEIDESPDNLNQVLALLRTRTQFDFRCYRRKMLTRRVERRMGLNRCDHMSDYLAFLREHPDEVKHLARDLLISVTHFFRDPEAFQALEAKVIAPLVETRETEASLRVWVPGCATGEEPYSIAMLLLERLGAAQKSCRLQVFATDADEQALEVARQGVYPESIAADVSPERLARFFTGMDDSAWQINKQVREAVVFAVQNLLGDAPFSRMDLVSCRNVLIYLEPEVQKKVIALLHFALREGGYLFLGPSETIGRQTDLFEPVSTKWRIYRRIGPSRHDHVAFPIVAGSEPLAALRRPAEAAPTRPVSFAEITKHLLLEELAGAAVLINRKCEVLYFLGATTKYLEVPAGEPTQDLVMMAREGLRTKLRSALRKAIREGLPVRLADVQVRRDGGYCPITVTIKPAQDPRVAEGLLLVLFQDADAAPKTDGPELEVDEPLVRQLEYELRATKEELQSGREESRSASEELKASNEEAMSMNEELQSANEELETSKEELQSLNEELSTVNNQLQDKVEELESANNDMANLLGCTEIAFVFLDASLRIRRFTPPITRLLNLIATDVGRPFSDIALRFHDRDLLPELEDVLRDLTPREKEVQTGEGRSWIRRIVPYRTADNRTQGVVLTFIDVTRVRQTDKQERLLATILRDSLDAIVVKDFDGQILAWNRGAERLYGYSEAEARQMNVDRLIPEDLREEARSRWRRLQHGEQFPSWDSRRIARDGRIVDVWITATALTDEAGQPVGIATIHRDISDRKRLQVQLERRSAELYEQQERLRAILDTASDAIITVDRSGIIESVNRAAEAMVGYPAAEIVGRNVKMLMPSPYQQQYESWSSKSENDEAGMIGSSREVEVLRKDGSSVPVELSVSAVDHLDLFTGILRDISERKRLEREVVEIAALEQQRIGQNLHDECGQELTALGLLANSLTESLSKSAPSEVEMARKIEQGANRVLRQVRNISRGLAQAEVDPAGLSAALTELTSRLSETSGVRCLFHSEEGVGIEDSVTATHLFHIAQEACTNALRHAQASTIEVCLRTDGATVILQVQDDGRGISDQPHEGLGLRIMRNRATMIGAVLTVEPGRASGTVVTCTLNKERRHAAKNS